MPSLFVYSFVPASSETEVFILQQQRHISTLSMGPSRMKTNRNRSIKGLRRNKILKWLEAEICRFQVDRKGRLGKG
ncbi:hypothetical protein ATANTOWER_025018 [Ataeniobius toweri]|uniref:Uncharacterized protein n=1 Tax=Ataeniobius toweri TaxID=208326 RepID=A0ABU7AGW7_9TELE|nr:hypothetical protein [Ataeniobius toweri]